MSRTLSEAEQRLRQVTSLKDGWYGGDEGIGPDPRLYHPLRSLLLSLLAEKLPLPYIYPIYEGGVQCEWAGSLKDMRGVERVTLSHVETVGLLRDRDDLVTDCGGGGLEHRRCLHERQGPLVHRGVMEMAGQALVQ